MCTKTVYAIVSVFVGLLSSNFSKADEIQPLTNTLATLNESVQEKERAAKKAERAEKIKSFIKTLKSAPAALKRLVKKQKKKLDIAKAARAKEDNLVNEVFELWKSYDTPINRKFAKTTKNPILLGTQTEQSRLPFLDSTWGGLVPYATDSSPMPGSTEDSKEFPAHVPEKINPFVYSNSEEWIKLQFWPVALAITKKGPAVFQYTVSDAHYYPQNLKVLYFPKRVRTKAGMKNVIRKLVRHDAINQDNLPKLRESFAASYARGIERAKALVPNLRAQLKQVK